ncbi:ABC transporter permease [Periweissella fabaria]|uniref:ABC3 transporter permease C-terminal domain-containing protein n=1 Tax=Periweissella fabaria TaxID=546157 RepID=A0ABM8Z5I7_9LACO|nr:ABC transporter permease [Periweissella fabaria]MCM0597408.1 ABC transporter permease [Periweissella fabaria]CAH0416087.1 hypothetical protein WFA24289_00386 [Periweissella fabaria]
MLTKIAVQTIKTKWKNLLILFAGLVISTAIFYMFSTVANNKAFLTANTSIKSIIVVFVIGEILLGLITFIYLNFANRFLVQLRQREYGLLMMFGANKLSISRLLFMETFFLGLISLVMGSFLGAGLTIVAGNVLQKQLDLTLPHWQIFNSTGFIITICYFIIVFSLNGFLNQLYINRTDINKLLQANQSAEKTPKTGVANFITGIIGIVLLILSFVVMAQLVAKGIFILIALVLAIVLNISGTYLFIRSSLTLVLNVLKGSSLSATGLRRFTLGQLSFRLRAFERILTIVTLLFALALGALTVGRGYELSTPTLAEQSSPFTININQPSKQDDQLISQLQGVTYTKTYQYKQLTNEIVWDAAQFDREPLPYYKSSTSDNSSFTASVPKIQFGNANQISKPNPSDFLIRKTLTDLATATNPNHISIGNTVDTHKFAISKAPVKRVTIVHVKNMTSQPNAQILKKLAATQTKRFPTLATLGVSGAYGFLEISKGVFGGLEFMGFFLAIAFLVMLASTLMFKVLSNVDIDRRRYQILTMIGATPAQRIFANALEIAIIFIVPLTIGIIDVVYGLPMFKALMVNPYIGLTSSLLIIVSFYTLYYVLTVIIYQQMLKKGNK